MDYDRDQVDETTLALLYLVVHDRREGFGARAWKGFDWATMNRLHEKGYISNPRSKAKSVVMTEEGFKKSEALFNNLFSNTGSPITNDSSAGRVPLRSTQSAILAHLPSFKPMKP